MTSVLVTGGAGFVGSHIVDHFIEYGYDVTVIDNLADQVHDGEPDYLNPDANYVWGDIRDDERVCELLEDADVLSHQASAVGIGQSMYEIEHYVNTNTLGTANLLDIIVNEGIDLEKMVVALSMAIYGEGAYECPNCATVRYPSVRDDGQMQRGDWDHRCSACDTSLTAQPTPESTPRDSSNVYAITKKDQEELSISIGRAYGIPTVALRYFNVYGSRQALDNPYTGVCAIFSSRIKNDNPPLVFEDGEQTRDFVHVSDVARANRLAVEREVADEAINIGSGEATTIKQIATTLIDLYDKDSLTPKIANDFRQGDIRHCCADITKARELFGFEPNVEFKEGMRELVKWGRDQSAEDRFEKAHAELKANNLVDQDSS